MFFRNFTVFLVLFAWPLAGRACSYAYQYSLFALGEQAGRVWFVELDLERYVSTPHDRLMSRGRFGAAGEGDMSQIEVRWKGYIRLRHAPWDSLQSLETAAVLGRTDFKDEDYYDSLLPYFEQAKDSVDKLPDFIWALLPEIGYCHYHQQCIFFTRQVDTVDLKLYCQRPGEEAFEAPLPDKANEQLRVLMQSAADIQQSQQVFALSWKPYSLRRYRIGGRILLVYTIGRGQKQFYQQKPAAKQWQPPAVGSLEAYIEGNDVLFHGQRFDFCQEEQAKP